MAATAPTRGMFDNMMAYATWGEGPETMLYLTGGPGNDLPDRMGLRQLQRLWSPLVDAGYTVWVVTRPRNMPAGHTIPDMANDHAQLIRTEFGGRVELVVGLSYGGMIALYLAADHPDTVAQVVLVGAGYRPSEASLKANYRYAQAASTGDRTQAGLEFAKYLLPADRYRWLRRLLAPVVGRLTAVTEHEHYRHDIMVEAEAMLAFDASNALPEITVPVLLLAGDHDRDFPTATLDETARLIPDATLVLYPGQGHLRTATNKHLAADVLDHIRTHPAAPR
jgi:pimeloyl-ACP methyl ester carboxylesterase